MMINQNKGQAFLEGIFTILLVLVLMFGTYKLFYTATVKILSERQLMDLFETGHIKQQNYFGAKNNVYPQRDDSEGQIKVEVKIDDLDISSRTEIDGLDFSSHTWKELIDGTISNEHTFER